MQTSYIFLNKSYEFVQTNFTTEVGTATRPPLTYLISGVIS